MGSGTVPTARRRYSVVGPQGAPARSGPGQSSGHHSALNVRGSKDELSQTRQLPTPFSGDQKHPRTTRTETPWPCSPSPAKPAPSFDDTMPCSQRWLVMALQVDYEKRGAGPPSAGQHRSTPRRPCQGSGNVRAPGMTHRAADWTPFQLQRGPGDQGHEALDRHLTARSPHTQQAAGHSGGSSPAPAPAIIAGTELISVSGPHARHWADGSVDASDFSGAPGPQQ